jgi:hypothetical protein
MKKLNIALLFVLFTTPIFSQIKVIASGNTKIGVEGSANNNDPSGMVRLQILGNGPGNSDCCQPGGKLAFGDFGTPASGGMHAFVGEVGNTDTDMLQLHGRRGVNITSTGNAGFTGAYFEEWGGLNVVGQVKSWGVVLTSDIRKKKNIQSLNSTLCLTNILKLKGLAYDFKTDKEDAFIESLNQLKPKEAKEIQGVADSKKNLEKKKLDLANQIGFSAQDIKTVFPNLVKEDEEGFLSVNYMALIPVLVEAMKEQQKTIDDQAKTIEAIKKKVGM